MSRISIYIIKEITSSFLFIFSLLTVVVWLSQALKHLDLLSNDSVSISTYFIYAILLLPKLSLITIPISIFLGIIFGINKLRLDSELIIFGSTGNSNRDILFKPLAFISIIFFLIVLFLSTYLVPICSAEIRNKIIEIRNSNIDTSILKERRFITPDSNLTVFFKKIIDQDIYGILLHDRTEENNIKTYVAKSGYLNNENGNSLILLYNGTMQIYDSKSQNISKIDFESYSVDLRAFNKAEKKFYYADEKSTSSLLNKILNNENNREEYGIFHSRFVKALYVFALVFLPLIIFKLIKKPDDKSGLIMALILFSGLFIKFFEITMESLLIENNDLIFMSYLSPVVFIIIIFFTLFIKANIFKNFTKVN